MSLLRTMTAKKGQGVLQCHPDASMYQIGKCRTFSFFFFFKIIMDNYTKVFQMRTIAKT